MTHLDTSFLVDLLRERTRGAEGPAHRLLQTLADEELAISIHVSCELHAGAELSDAPAEEHLRVDALCAALRVVPADGRFPLEYGRLFGEMRRRGESIAAMNLLIAAAARVEDARLVTRNVRDFERVPGLTVLSY
ncbi:MAG TPA: type II toxin-antitoxin system VapC family toxin [Gemmatimonadaceae bacterium]|nr:type II toxin-antitoxin system VapC family toxin [Gemmatimonadaceae bacterium]